MHEKYADREEMNQNGNESNSEMRDPLGKGMDKAGDTIRRFPPRPVSWDAPSVFVTASAEPSRSLANGSPHSVFSLRTDPSESTRPKEQVCSILDAMIDQNGTRFEKVFLLTLSRATRGAFRLSHLGSHSE